MRIVLYVALIVMYVLHNDLWLWHEGRLVMGLPVGMMYHVVYCVVAAGVMALLVRFAWDLDEEADHT